MVNCMIGTARGSGTNSGQATHNPDPGAELDCQIPRQILIRSSLSLSMMQRLLHPDIEIGEEDPDSVLGFDSGRRNHHDNGYQWWHLTVLVIVSFPYIAIVGLFCLYGSIEKISTNKVSLRKVDTLMS